MIVLKNRRGQSVLMGTVQEKEAFEKMRKELEPLLPYLCVNERTT